MVTAVASVCGRQWSNAVVKHVLVVKRWGDEEAADGGERLRRKWSNARWSNALVKYTGRN